MTRNVQTTGALKEETIRLISLNEMCSALGGISEKTARRNLIDTGLVETRVLGRRRLVVLSSLNDYINALPTDREDD